MRSGKEQLTQDETAARLELRDDILVVLDGVKETFPQNSPQRREFHIGMDIQTSTPRILGYADDVINTYSKYKDVIVEKGCVIDKDIANLAAAKTKLYEIDRRQERAKKKDSPEATDAFQKVMDELLVMADKIHAAAAAEFKKEPAIAKQFKAAKKLRETPPLRKSKQNPPTSEN